MEFFWGYRLFWTYSIEDVTYNKQYLIMWYTSCTSNLATLFNFEPNSCQIKLYNDHVQKGSIQWTKRVWSAAYLSNYHPTAGMIKWQSPKHWWYDSTNKRWSGPFPGWGALTPGTSRLRVATAAKHNIYARLAKVNDANESLKKFQATNHGFGSEKKNTHTISDLRNTDGRKKTFNFDVNNTTPCELSF